MYIKITNFGEDSVSFVSWNGDAKVLYPCNSVVLNEPWGNATREYYAKLFRGTEVSIIAPYDKAEVVESTPLTTNTIKKSAEVTITPEEVVTEETTTTSDTIVENTVEEVASEDVKEEKPLKAMNVKELYEYAEAKGITLEEGLTKRQLIQELNK